MIREVKCYVCGELCEGTTGAVIDDVFRPMCHEGPDPTCYQKWAWEQHSRVDMMIADPDRYFGEAMARHVADIKAERKAKRRRWSVRGDKHYCPEHGEGA